MSIVILPKLEIKRVELEIEGTTTLITHAWSEKAKKQMRDKQQKKAKLAKEAKDPEADFLAAKYMDEDGRDCLPSLSFKNAIVSAQRFCDGMKMTVLRGAIFVEGDLIPITFKECRMREDMVRVGMGTADLRYRPEYVGWSCKVVVQFNSTVLSLEQVINLVRLAGFSVGVCEWRPEKDGDHGRFDVKAANAA